MDLQKRIELYFGVCPLDSQTPEIGEDIARYREFCGVFPRTDVPSQIIESEVRQMLAQYGPMTSFANERGAALVGFKVHPESGKVWESGKTGGVFFPFSISQTITDEFIKIGYEIIKKYE